MDRALTLVGGVAVLAGAVGAAVVTWWYAIDAGWTGTGSVLVAGQASILVAALVSGAAVLVGLTMLAFRRSAPGRGALLVAAGSLVAASVPAALATYPQVEHVRLLDHRNGWETALPISEVWGVRSETDGQITIEGRADRRGCQARFRSVTLDRRTGRVTDVGDLPRAYDDPSQVPSEPAPLDPAAFEVRPGSSPFICTS